MVTYEWEIKITFYIEKNKESEQKNKYSECKNSWSQKKNVGLS